MMGDEKTSFERSVQFSYVGVFTIKLIDHNEDICINIAIRMLADLAPLKPKYSDKKILTATIIP
jgi:hypothetical protein